MTQTLQDLQISLAGQEFWLMPERGLFWPGRRWLLVADTHWGKCQAFRDAGAPVPIGPLLADLDRLSSAAQRVSAERVIVLGDMVHGPSAFAPGMDQAIQGWRPNLAADLLLVPGNHDRGITSRRAKGLLERWNVQLADASWEIDGLVLTHQPPSIAGPTTLCGHVHPAVRLRGRGESMKLPCFWRDAAYDTLVLPAFSSMVDGVCVAVNPGDDRWATSASRVLRV